MYTPDTYPGLIAPGSSDSDVPIGTVWMTTTTGGLDGVVGNPICQYHTSDANLYSDFVEVVLVAVDNTYVADTYKSAADIAESGNPTTNTGTIVNMPVVPTGSTLQDPADKDAAAPISPVTCWYRGNAIDTYVFEVTSQDAVDFFADTRATTSADYAIPVTNYASIDRVSAIPLWHVNQYTRGVTAGEGGGPSPDGHRNVINLDRGDDGYSPLWEIAWVSEVPINYSADEASNSKDFSAANGFKTLFGLPMFVNCPDIGAVGALNLMRRTAEESEFELKLNLDQETNWILGSADTLIMTGGVEVTFVSDVDGSEIARTETNIMGAYELELASSDVPAGTTKVKVMAFDKEIRTVEVKDGSTSAAFMTNNNLAAWMGATSLLVAALFLV